MNVVHARIYDDEGERNKNKKSDYMIRRQSVREWEGFLDWSIGDCQTKDQPWGMARKSLTETSRSSFEGLVVKASELV